LNYANGADSDTSLCAWPADRYVSSNLEHTRII